SSSSYSRILLFHSFPTRRSSDLIGWRLLQKKLGFRMLMDVIPLDSTLVKGSHGRRPADSAHYPLLVSQEPKLLLNSLIEATDVRSEEHTSELQSRVDLVCRLLLE